MDSVALCNHLMSSTGLFTCLLNTQNQLRGVQVAAVCHQTPEDWSLNARYVHHLSALFISYVWDSRDVQVRRHEIFSINFSQDFHFIYTNVCDACPQQDKWRCICIYVMSAFFHERINSLYLTFYSFIFLQLKNSVFVSRLYFFLRLGRLNLTPTFGFSYHDLNALARPT